MVKEKFNIKENPSIFFHSWQYQEEEAEKHCQNESDKTLNYSEKKLYPYRDFISLNLHNTVDFVDRTLD